MSVEWLIRLGFAYDNQIQSALLALQGGMEGGLAAAELLVGDGNPSGKTVDTFAKSLDDYPSTYNFHESRNYVDYTDDIYVGYRYFETIPELPRRLYTHLAMDSHTPHLMWRLFLPAL